MTQSFDTQKYAELHSAYQLLGKSMMAIDQVLFLYNALYTIYIIYFTFSSHIAPHELHIGDPYNSVYCAAQANQTVGWRQTIVRADL